MRHATPRNRPSGFTLVELLVVIGIIAVLISLLLPSLNKAREAAKLVACGSQLRQVAVAARAYAIANRDFLPPWAMDLGSPYYTAYDNVGDGDSTTSNANAPGQRAAAVRAWNWPWWLNAQTGAEMDNPQIGAGIGRLIVTKYMGGPFYKVQQCPAVYEGETTRDADNRNYIFNPHLARRSAPNVAPEVLLKQPWWKQISKVGKVPGGRVRARNQASGAEDLAYQFQPRVWALALDPIVTPGSGPQWGAMTHVSKGRYAINVAGADGSVVTAFVPRTVTRAGGNWGRFMDLLGYVELSAHGNAPPTLVTNAHAWVPVNP